jgi:exonuclease V
MASPALQSPLPEPQNDDNDTDYGSDFSAGEEEIVSRLLSGASPVLEEDNPITTEIEYHDAQQTLRLPRIYAIGDREERSPLFQAARAAEKVAEQLSRIVKGEQYPDRKSRPSLERITTDLTDAQRLVSNRIRGPTLEIEAETQAVAEAGPVALDTRSPLERFRTQPKKALSVTDLVSPAWCELQYWYTLTKHGKKRRNPAMREGSRVHKVLEDQVHTTVKVDITTKEDAWGLRIWNVIQGLKTLRDTGMTRELEIWGTVDGLVVNGVIDELSYVCPDTGLEESIRKPTTQDEPPLDQTTIADFFKATGSSISEAIRPKRRSPSKKVYVCDVKTRGVRSVPSAAAFRPTKIQLMLYHRLLSLLATNTVDFSILTSRYKLDASKTFSDSFIAQVGSLNEEYFSAQTSPSQSQESSQHSSSQDSMTILLEHNNLSALWSLMITEFQLTLPDGAASLGSVLKAEYRSRDDGEIVGSKTFLMNDGDLDSYVQKEMQWWKGEREAVGVVVEEAFKCRSCDFAEECEWRLKKVEEAKEKVRMRRRRNSNV